MEQVTTTFKKEKFLKSWHFKYYKMVVDDQLPRSLCPYWWTMVALCLFSPLVFLFLGLSALGVLISKIFPQKEKKTPKVIDYEKEAKRARQLNKIAGYFGKGVIILLGSLLVFVLVLSFITSTKSIGLWATIKNILAFIGGFTLFIGFVSGVVEWGSKVVKSKYIQIPVGMFVAWFKKKCPLIIWE